MPPRKRDLRPPAPVTGPPTGRDDGRPRTRARWAFAGRWLLTLLAVLVPACAWGVATATAEASLGPHVARYEVTLDDAITVDLGPLGTLVIDSPLPLVLGAHVVVQEIPREVTAVDEAGTLSAVGADLEGYVQFFSGPQDTLDVVRQELMADAARRAALAVAVLGVVIWVVRTGLGDARSAELAAQVRPHRALATTGVVVGLVVTLGLTGSDRLEREPVQRGQATSVFDGTPLEGARITGRLAGVIDTYGEYVVDVYRDNEIFYDSAVVELEAVWRDRVESDAELAAARASALPTASPSPTPDDATAEDGEEASEGDGGAEPEADLVTVLTVTDLHCNVGMARVIRAVAELSGARVVLNAGDSTINGTGVESYCVSALVGAVPDEATMVVSDGNHDSEETSAQERAAGAVVLDGDVVEVEGIRVLGDSDPNATRIGAGTTLVGVETVADQGRRLADLACDDEAGVDLLLVHNPNTGNLAMDRGCVPAQVSGHLHRRVGPVVYGEGVRFVGASTAGAALDQATVGPLNGVAELAVLRFDRTTRRFVDYRLVRLHPDGDVSVGFAVRWPGSTQESPSSGGPR
ncbi:MAG: metallophosphoesterase [Actinotalea sp.]|nr:metallophosphoesterase [Actinotalea sp.]